MQYGVTLPYLDPQIVADLAVEIETAGWDGLFVWDAIWGLDCWVCLTAAAMRTQRIKLGPMLVPVSRKKPWEVASTAMTLDRLTNGRVILSVGLGAPETGWAKVGEETDRKIRAARLDEGLQVIQGFWSGQPFSFSGEYFKVDDVTCEPAPTHPIPIWVVGQWPSRKSLGRTIQYQGCILAFKDFFNKPYEEFAVDVPATVNLLRELRGNLDGFDRVLEGETPGDDRAKAVAQLRPYTDAGLTWWLENVFGKPYSEGGVEGIRQRIRQGPPKSHHP